MRFALRSPAWTDEMGLMIMVSTMGTHPQRLPTLTGWRQPSPISIVHLPPPTAPLPPPSPAHYGLRNPYSGSASCRADRLSWPVKGIRLRGEVKCPLKCWLAGTKRMLTPFVAHLLAFLNATLTRTPLPDLLPMVTSRQQFRSSATQLPTDPAGSLKGTGHKAHGFNHGNSPHNGSPP